MFKDSCDSDSLTAGILSQDAVASLLSGSRQGNLYYYDSVDSTNNILKDLASKGSPSGTAVIADHQTNGRGRRGRSFVSPSGAGIYLSYLFKPQNGFDRISDITALTAVAVADSIKKAYGLDTQIKWVNDILMNRKKVCGILVEAFSDGTGKPVDSCIIGIGINVNDAAFPSELSEIASSISKENDGKCFDRALLAAELISSLDALGNGTSEDNYYLERFRELCITTGSRITAFPQMTEQGQGRNGTALSVNDDFSLRVRFDDGTEEDLRSGEVSVRGLYGYT